METGAVSRVVLRFPFLPPDSGLWVRACFALTADVYREKVGICYGLNFVLQKDNGKSSPLAPVNGTLFGNKVFTDVIKLR